MLQVRVARKTMDLPRWTGNFDQRLLLILNCNPLADEVPVVESTLQQLIRKEQVSTGLDGFFWSRASDRSLIKVSSP